jgi:hypothetical protein
MVYGCFHCPVCGYDRLERYPISEFDWVCPTCGRTTHYNVIAVSDVEFTCPACSVLHHDTEFLRILPDFSDPDMSGLTVEVI